MKPLIIGLSYDIKTIFLVFCYQKHLTSLTFLGGTLEWKWINLGNFDRTVTKFSFPYKPFGIYAKLFTFKLSLACLFISLIELLKFKLESPAKWCTLEYFIAFAYTIYVSNIRIKTIYWGILFPITDIKNPINMGVGGSLIPANINNDDKRIWIIYYILAVHSTPGVYSG